MSPAGSRGRVDLADALRVTVITDRDMLGDRAISDVVEVVLSAGVGAVQLRDKTATPRALLGMARELREVTARHAALLFINDRLDVALAAGADGVHLGPDDVPVAAARRAAPRPFLIGHSTDDPAAARRAEADGADYLGCGTVYPTSTKGDAGDVIGLEGLERVASAVDIPVVGIGGITGERAAAVRRAGAAGVAVISSVMTAPDPAEAARALLDAVTRGDA